MRTVLIGVMLLALVSAELVSVEAAEQLAQTEVLNATNGGRFSASNVAGKKLIRLSQELIDPPGVWSMAEFDLPAKVKAWQEAGYDGLAFSISSYDEAKREESPNKGYAKVFGLWWDVRVARTYEEFVPEIETFQSVEDWGRLTDNFLWTMTSVGGGPQDWFNDEHWQIVLNNARLSARISKNIGFKGISLDTEEYFSGNAPGKVWMDMWNYRLYADSGYKLAGEEKPRSFAEVSAKVRQRARQYAEAISSVYPDITLFVISGGYGVSWMKLRYGSLYGDGTLPGQIDGLYPAFIDGLLLGLDEQATIVLGTERTYMHSRYEDMLVVRDEEKEQGLILSTVPELARKRISFSVGIWTDAGLGADRFSDTDVNVNHRDPKRHKHAVHNALAASDKYAWQWGANPWQWLAAEPTPLIREYWQANIEGHQPQELLWEPEPKWDMTDYTDYDAEMADKDAAFWNRKENEGWQAAAELPIYWRFLFDTEFLLLSRDYYLGRGGGDFDDTGWPLISALECWQSQGTRASGPAIYRARFDAPADLNPDTQTIMLAFGGYSPRTSANWFDVWMNGTGYGPRELIDVSKSVRPGQSNLVAVRILEKSGPDGLMGHVKLLVRDSRGQ